MAVNTLNTNVHSSRSVKKRKMGMNNPFNDDLSNSIIKSEETSIDIEYIKKENDETPTKKKCDNKNLQNNSSNCSNKEKTNVLQHSDGNCKVKNDTNGSLISIRKMEDLCKTPIRNKSLNESIHRDSIKNENTSSPARFSPSMLTINSSEWNYNAARELSQEISTPTKKKKLYIDEHTELYDDTLNEMEHIEMLHDLDSVMDFEDTKISIFLSSTTNDTQDEENIGVSKDPQVDPLSIDKHDMHDIVVKTRLRNRRKNVKNTEIKFTNNEFNETPSGIKIALGELDIQSDTESEELSEDTKKRLYNLKVQLTHNVPPQHKIQSNLRLLTKAEKALFLQHASLRRGAFLPHEDEIIKDNWKKFCEVHDWNPKIVKPFICMRHRNGCYIKSPEERQKFVQYLANGLPCRSLNSVLQRCRTLFIKYEKSFERYCSAEDEIILSYMKINCKKRRKQHNHFSKLAEMLKRERHSVWLRYKKLKNMQSSRTKKPIVDVEWTLQLVGEFIHNLMNITLCEKVEELKDASIPKPIWLKLEKKLNIDWSVLKGFWIYRLHMQLFSPEPIYLNDIKIKLIEYIYGKGISSTREILWPNVARYFDGVTSIFLCKIFFYMVQEAAKKIYTTHLPDIIEYLYNSKMHDIQNSCIDKFLPRLSYKDRNVKIIDGDTDNYIAKKI
ncbi:uncharacterized protein LOC143361481 isoform X2 [Halictus rubicundus]|uniref:uncharacterized protein LOC143361481 isoform X2 n=1 Tax=Halictus rubicundus TaxID=77578 RepID=UPI00403521CC